MTNASDIDSRPSDAEFEAMIATAHRGIRREMRHPGRWCIRQVFTGGIVALVVAGGGAAVATQIDRDDQSPVSMFPAGPAAPPTVGDDVTIGPWRINQAPPDLVPIDLEDGRSGYVRTYDLAHGSENPDFWRKVGNHQEIVIPVYEDDAQTVIGEFVAGTSTGS